MICSSPFFSCLGALSGRIVDEGLTTDSVTTGTLPERQGPRVFFSTLRSISIPAWNLLFEARGKAVVLGQFARAVDLCIEDHIIALVLPAVGNGPFHGVVSSLPDGSLPREIPFAWENGRLRLGSWLVRMAPPLALWDPRVAWETLWLDGRAFAQLRMLVEAEARRRGAWQDGGVSIGGGFGRQGAPVAALATAWKSGDADAVLAAAAALAGWGPGLTPSGDDFLAGLMLALWAREGEAARPLCAQIVAAAAPRTTRLSGAFLRAAADGLADERWHALLYALAGASGPALEQAAQAVLAFGATSGLDMLAGFLWGWVMGNG